MSKARAISQLLQVFQQYGYEGATLAKLSQATGLGRASLYHHFPNGKEEMAASVLEYLDRGLQSHILAPLQEDLPPIDRLKAMNDRLASFYERGEQPCLLAILCFGEAHDLFHDRIQHTLDVWIDALATVAIETGIQPPLARQRAEDAVLQIQGSLVLSRGLKDSKIFQRVLDRLPQMLLDTNSANFES